MGYRDRSTSDEVLLLTNLCRHHEQTIAQMFAIQEPILRYARAMYFMEEHPREVMYLDMPPTIEDIEECIDNYEDYLGQPYTIDWEEA